MSKKHMLTMGMSLIVILVVLLGILQFSGYSIKDILGVASTETENFLDEHGSLKPVKEETKVVIDDMTKAFDIILEKGNTQFFEGYPLDVSFLHWVNNTFGEAVTMDIAYRMYEGYLDTDLWYRETGNSMHVLWLRYCEDVQIATYYLENVHWMDCASEEKIVIDFTGDINLADDWYTMEAAAKKENGIYDCISEPVMQQLQCADLSVVNNEFVISDRGKALKGKAYTFRAKTENAALLEVFGADLANLANNHVCDFGDKALLDTIKTLEKQGIATMGAGANLDEAMAIQYYVANGKKIAIVSATEIEKFYNYTKQATDTKPGVLKTLDPKLYNQVIKEAAANSDYVIANVHWGVEGTYSYSNSQYNLAKGFVKAGADAVIGGHPHRLQGIEYISNVPVVFSLGNFWFSTGTLYTTIAQIEIDKDGDLALKMVPCLQKDMKVTLLEGKEAKTFYKFIADISTNIVIDKEGYIYNTKNGKNKKLLDGKNIYSGNHYDNYKGNRDLEDRPIDIVGNLE